MSISLKTDDLFYFEDLFPTYPIKDKEIGKEIDYYYNQGNYYEINFRKKEFNMLKLETTEPKPKRGLPLKHQEFVSKFLSPFTTNDRLIAFHGLGTGKTCLAVNVAELASNINENQNNTLVLVRGPTSKRNFVRELSNVCTDGKYIPPNIELKGKSEEEKRYVKLTREQRAIRIGKIVRKSYTIDTFIKFANRLSRMTDDQIERNFSDRYIIIDEAHNLRFQPKESKVSLYDQIYRLLHKAQRIKILLLSGTPMRDRPEEIVDLLNLLIPEDRKITQKEFEKNMNDPSKLNNMFYGLVSYVRQMESNVKKIYEGDVAEGFMKKINTSRNKMVTIQRKSYIEAWEKDSKTKEIDSINDNDDDDEDSDSSDSLYERSRQASLMVFPDGTYGKDGIASNKWITKDGKGFWHVTTELANYLDKKGKDTNNRLEMLSNLSGKYADVIREIINNKDEKAFVYCSFVKGSGLMLFAAILEHMGFSMLNTNIFKREESIVEDDTTEEEKSLGSSEYFNIETLKKDKNRFALITGESLSSSIADKVINEIYNNPENTYGEYLRVILGSHVVGEGTSLYAVRQLHILSPHWNNSVTEQAIGRGLRTFAHQLLSPEERYIKLFRHATIIEDNKKSLQSSIDMRMYKLSEDKDISIKKVERAMKQSAVDCNLNRKRNIRLDIDQDDSAACDYQNCDYSCLYNINDNKDLIEDTYNLFFAEKEITEIINKLKTYFSINESSDLMSIIQNFSEYNNVLIIRALKKMIDDMIEINSKNGFMCFLKESDNLYYLTKRIDYPSSFLNSGYANVPDISPVLNLDYFIKESEVGVSEKFIDQINSLDFEEDDDKDKIIKIMRTKFGDKEREMFIEQFFLSRLLKIKKKVEFRRSFLSFFSKYIIDLEDYYVSFYTRPDLFYIKKSKIEEAKRELSINGKLSESTIEKLIWKPAKDKINKMFKEYELEKRIDLEKNEFGYYAIFTEDKKEINSFGSFIFKLMKSREEVSVKTDKRVIKEFKPGTKCGTGKFGINGLIEMLLHIVYILLRKGEDEKKFPVIPRTSKKVYDIEKIIENKTFKDHNKEERKLISENLKDKPWLINIIAGILELGLRSCNDISNWFLENELYTIY
jgi:superfamily II DNA or RNA helicase